MKTFLTIYCVSLTTLFIALPIEDHEANGNDSIDNSSPGEPSPRAEIQKHEKEKEEVVDFSELDKLEGIDSNRAVVMPEDQLDDVTRLCTNYCQRSRYCSEVGYDIGGYAAAATQPSFSLEASVKRSAPEIAITEWSVLEPTTPSRCTGSRHFYELFTNEQLKAANQCKRKAVEQMGSHSTFRSGTPNDAICCQDCVAKMNSQYRLATECGEKLEKLFLCLASSRSCTAQQSFFSSERNRIRKPNSPEYPCQECVLAFGSSCGKG